MPVKVKNQRHFVQIYTGDGKGKTTAAIGVAIRAIGAGWRVAWVAFDKGGDRYSERRVFSEHLADKIDFQATGLDRRNQKTGTFRFGITAADRQEAARGLKLARAAARSGKYGLVVLDELLTAVSLGLASERAVLAIIKSRSPKTELILTGRGATMALQAAADLVSEMRPIKHYFEQKINAREGVDF